MQIDLRHIRALVTRPEPQGSALCRLIEGNGGYAINLPTLAFTPPPAAVLQAQLATLDQQEIVIFISPQAVHATYVAIKNRWPYFPMTQLLAAIGPGTAHALQRVGLKVSLQPNTVWSAEGLLALPAFQRIYGKKIALLQGRGGNPTLEKTLLTRGAQVTSMIAYERVLPQLALDDYWPILKQPFLNVVIATSGEGVKNLKYMLGEEGWPWIKSLPLAVMSARIKSLAEDLGFQTIWVSHRSSQQAIIELLAQKGKSL